MNINTFLEKTVAITFDFPNDLGEKEGIELTVKEHSLTPRILTTMQELAKNEDVTELPVVLAQIVTNWSIDADGEPFPPTLENLNKLPVNFLAAMAEAVAGVWAGNAPKPNPSANSLADSAQSQTETVN